MIAAWRLACTSARLAWLLPAGLLTLRRFPRLTPEQRAAAIRRWSLQMLRACRVDLAVHGHMHPGPCMLAINHISWLDIMALNAVQPTRFVAKADIARWPLIGSLVRGAGTLFIERERPRDAMRVMHDMAQALKAGDVISVFPEGTTSDGSGILPLHANLFQAAVSTGMPVQPVLLRYVEAATARPSAAPAYVGDDSLATTLQRMARAPRLRAEVHFLPALPACDNRRELCTQVHTALSAALNEVNGR